MAPLPGSSRCVAYGPSDYGNHPMSTHTYPLNGALMFADDYVGMCESGAELQRMIDVLHAFARKYRFQANAVRCAVVVFSDSRNACTDN
jgi:hypothetical protein